MMETQLLFTPLFAICSDVITVRILSRMFVILYMSSIDTRITSLYTMTGIDNVLKEVLVSNCYAAIVQDESCRFYISLGV